MGNPKSIRFKDALKKDIEDLASKNGTTFNNQVIVILKEYCNNVIDRLITISGEPYYPVYLTNEELILILEGFISNYNDRYNCQVKVRKDSGGKGVDFQINFLSEYKTKPEIKKSYSFSINAYWEIDNTFVHWVEENGDNFKGNSQLSKKIKIDIHSINSIINENIQHSDNPGLNLNFKDDSWKVLFERKYPLLKVL